MMATNVERTRLDSFQYDGLGPPVLLRNVPMVRVRGVWTPDVDYNQLSRRLLAALVDKRARLTGDEVRFIRHTLALTLEQFARRFGVTHPAVMKWERQGNRPTAMAWAVEKDIRLEALRSLSDVQPARFLEAYSTLAEKPSEKENPVVLDLQPA